MGVSRLSYNSAYSISQLVVLATIALCARGPLNRYVMSTALHNVCVSYTFDISNEMILTWEFRNVVHFDPIYR